MKLIELSHIAGLRITARWSALVAFVVVWAVLTALALSRFHLPAGTAIIGALVATLSHFLFELVHQLGHSVAARRTGFPMIGVRFWGPLAASIYPKDEPPLPGRTHIQRAIGGPILSGLMALLSGIVYLFLSGTFTIGQTEPHLDAVIPLVGAFIFLDNLLVFTLGALLPLGFTDGSTILKWWGK